MPATVLITGANGFLARSVAALAPTSWRLAGLVRPGSGTAHRVTALQAHYDSVDALIEGESRVDAVLHLAACIPRDLHQFDPRLAEVNVELPARLLREFPNARHVLASSVSVLASGTRLPLEVSSPTIPQTPYGWSKLAAENLVRMARSHAVLRLSSIIGAGMRPNSFVPTALIAARSGRIVVFGDGSRLQDYIDVRDAARMCIAATQREDNMVTLAVSGRSYSNAHVARELARLTGARIEFAGEDASASFAYTQAGAVDLGPCQHSLRETLEDMVSG